MTSKISEERKASMKKYYEIKGADINRNRLLQRIESGKQTGIQRAVLEKYDWTDEERAVLEPLVNEKVVRARRKTPNTAGSTFGTVKFTKDQFEAVIAADPKTKTAESKRQWGIVYNNFKRIFQTTDGAFTDFLLKSNDEIASALDSAYPNVTTRIKQYQFIPKLWNIMGERFQSILGEDRYKVWDRLQNDVSQLVKAGKQNRREDDSQSQDYVPIMIDLFKRELELRKKSQGTVSHALAVLYTVGVYENISKPNEPTFIPRLDYDYVIIVDDDAQMVKTDGGKYYNMNSGRLAIKELKTDRFYSYDFVLNPVAKEQLDFYIKKTKKQPGNKLFNLTSKKMPGAFKSALGVGNREYRRTWQNVYHKIFKVPIAKMSNPMAHDVDTATNTYMDSYKYTETERKKSLAAIKDQLALSFAQ